MSNLVAIAYPDRETADKVRQELITAAKEKLVELEDIVVVTNDDGKVKLHQTANTTGVGAAGGAVWGGLIGLIFLAPLLGMAVGAASGAVGGKLTDIGVDDKFMKELGTKLDPGSAALFVLVHKSTPDKLLPRVAQYGGHVIQSSLDDEAEGRLKAALGGTA